jgi:hypothetical protein
MVLLLVGAVVACGDEGAPDTSGPWTAGVVMLCLPKARSSSCSWASARDTSPSTTTSQRDSTPSRTRRSSPAPSATAAPPRALGEVIAARTDHSAHPARSRMTARSRIADASLRVAQRHPMTDDQLSRHERTVLQALEDSLRDEDPAFVERFGLDARALDGRSGGWWRTAVPHWLRRRSTRDQHG